MSRKPLERVILIDDGTLENRLHQRLIERSGLVKEVLTFDMAEKALAFFRAPDALPAELILLDINMPRMDGFEMIDAALAEFGKAFEDTPVAFLTTSLNPQDRSKAACYGMVRAYLGKPLSIDRFAALVTSLQPSATGGNVAHQHSRLR